jgi:hypothetical protein
VFSLGVLAVRLFAKVNIFNVENREEMIRKMIKYAGGKEILKFIQKYNVKGIDP